jgi:hypothetical protein
MTSIPHDPRPFVVRTVGSPPQRFDLLIAHCSLLISTFILQPWSSALTQSDTQIHTDRPSTTASVYIWSNHFSRERTSGMGHIIVAALGTLIEHVKTHYFQISSHSNTIKHAISKNRTHYSRAGHTKTRKNTLQPPPPLRRLEIQPSTLHLQPFENCLAASPLPRMPRLLRRLCFACCFSIQFIANEKPPTVLSQKHYLCLACEKNGRRHELPTNLRTGSNRGSREQSETVRRPTALPITLSPQPID